MQTRRTFLRRGAVTAGGALALSPVASALAKPGGSAGYGPLIEAPAACWICRAAFATAWSRASRIA